MSFSSPGWLLLLLLVPLLIALHALSIRWRPTPCSSLVFWNEVLRERNASLRIRRLLTSLVLLLQMLADGGHCAGAGGAAHRGTGPGGNPGRGPGAGRHRQHAGARGQPHEVRHRARARVGTRRRPPRRCANGGGAGGEGSPPAFPLHQRPRRTAPAAREARPTDEAGDVAASTLFAMSLRDPRRGGQVVLETDGAFDDLPGVDTSLPWLRVDLVGTAQPNVGITQMSFRLGLRSGRRLPAFPRREERRPPGGPRSPDRERRRPGGGGPDPGPRGGGEKGGNHPVDRPGHRPHGGGPADA